MKKYILSFLVFNFILLSVGIKAQNTLTGIIQDKNTGEGLYGAIIRITDLKRSCISDTAGNFAFNSLPKGRFILDIQLIGYSSKTMAVEVNGPSFFKILMDPTNLELSQVVVTGVSHATELKRNPVPITVVDKDYLNTNISTNAMDGIAKVPGVNAVSTGPNVSKPFIRGLGYNRILTLYDGVRQEGQQWGDEHGIEIDENIIDKIEIVKGPASLIYGSDALAGVINILPPPPPPDGKIEGAILGNYQSNNGLFDGSATLAGNNNGYTWNFRATHKEATNYQNKIDGRVFGTAFKETDASAMFGINKAWGYSHLSLNMFDDLQEIPDGSRDSASRKFTKQITEKDLFRPIVSNAELNSYTITPLHQHVQYYRAYSNSVFELGTAGKFAISAGYQISRRREYNHPILMDTAGLDLLLQTFTYDFKYFLPDFHGWEPAIGINGMYQVNRNQFDATEFIIPDFQLFDIGPFAFVKKAYRKLDISAGIRYDSRSFQNSSLSTISNSITGFDERASANDTGLTKRFSSYHNTFSGVSGSIGATYNFSDNFLIKANIARGYRAPNISEIAANGIHPGTNIYQIGNPDFKPEFSLQEDIGIFFNSTHISLSIEAFNNDISNYIYNQKLVNTKGQDSIIVPGNQTFKFTSSHAQLYGGEINLDIHPHPLDWLHFENELSVVYAQNLGGNGININNQDKYLPFIPPIHTSSELRANFKYKKARISNAFLKISLEYYAKQDKVLLINNTETVTPSYALINAGIGGDIINKNGKTICSIFILGNNLSDRAYQSHLSRLKYFEPYPNNTSGHYGIYNMGRNISLKLLIPISIKS